MNLFVFKCLLDGLRYENVFVVLLASNAVASFTKLVTIRTKTVLSVCEKNISAFSCNSEVLQYQQIIHLVTIKSIFNSITLKGMSSVSSSQFHLYDSLERIVERFLLNNSLI